MTTTDTLGKIVCASGRQFFVFANGTTDGTEGEAYVLDIGGSNQSIGDACDGETIVRIALQPSTGSVQGAVKLYDPTGGVLLHAVGCEQTSNQLYGIDIQNIAIRIVTGCKLKLTTAD